MSDYLATARAFMARIERNERNEQSSPPGGVRPSHSFLSYPEADATTDREGHDAATGVGLGQHEAGGGPAVSDDLRHRITITLDPALERELRRERPTTSLTDVLGVLRSVGSRTDDVVADRREGCARCAQIRAAHTLAALGFALPASAFDVGGSQ